MPPMPSSLRTALTAPNLDGWMIASSLVIFLASFAVAQWMTANALAAFLCIEEALLGATVSWTRRCVPRNANVEEPLCRSSFRHGRRRGYQQQLRALWFPYEVCEQSARRANSKFRWPELKYFILSSGSETRN